MGLDKAKERERERELSCNRENSQISASINPSREQQDDTGREFLKQ